MVKLDILSDPICPWCYIGKTYLDRALAQRPDHGLQIVWHPFQLSPDMPAEGMNLIATCEGPFKQALDHTKYATRYPDLNPQSERAQASDFIHSLDTRLAKHPFLTGDRPTLADIAIFPFVRQFAHIDRAWFDAQSWPNVISWLDGFLQSADFQTAMTKVAVWEEGARPYLFGQVAD